MRREEIEQCADAFPCCLDRALGGLAQKQLEFGEDLFDRIEIGTVGRQEQQLGASRPDRPSHGLTLVAAEIVHDDDVAG